MKQNCILPHQSWEENLRLVDKELMVYPNNKSKTCLQLNKFWIIIL